MKDHIQIGWAERDMTPDGAVLIYGEFYEQLSPDAESPLMATAMAIESGGVGTVLVSCDMIAIPEQLTREVRRLLAGRAPGLDPETVILLATHIHTGPDCEGLAELDDLKSAMRFVPAGKPYRPLFSPGNGVLDAVQCLTFLSERIANAVEAAWNSRSDALISPEFGRAMIGYCRRMQFDDGTAKTTGKKDMLHLERIEGGSDDGVELLYVFDGAKRLTGVVVNLACPAQSAEGLGRLSSDFWGKARNHIKARFSDDVHVLAICGAAGDQGVFDHTRHYRYNDLPEDKIQRADLLGQRISHVVEERYDAALAAMTQDVLVQHLRFDYDAPIRRVCEAEYTAARQAFDAYVTAHDKPFYDHKDMQKLHVHAGILTRYTTQDIEPTRHLELHAVRLGDLVIVTNPFELFLEYGIQIRARAAAFVHQVMIAQLACNNFAYLPTRVAEQGGGYSGYVASGYIGSEGGKLLVSRSLDAITRLFPES